MVISVGLKGLRRLKVRLMPEYSMAPLRERCLIEALAGFYYNSSIYGICSLARCLCIAYTARHCNYNSGPKAKRVRGLIGSPHHFQQKIRSN